MKQAKLRDYGMFANKQYGKLPDINDIRLKQMINKLLLDDYLIQTNDKYGLLRVSSSGRELINGEHNVIMKLAKEEPRVASESGKASKKKRAKKDVGNTLTSKGLQLFENLRVIRTRLAKEEGMPPYIIFSDKTLIDMCIKLPANKSEMLTVSGVGENKYQKYGTEFIDAIVEFSSGKKEQYYYEED